MAFGWKSITGAVGRAADYLTPGAGSNRLTDWSGWGDPPRSAGGGGGGGGWGSPNPKPKPSNVVEDRAFKDLMASTNAQIAALQAQIAARPKLAQFDVMANWRNAQSAAEKAQNPLYAQKLKTFLKQQAGKKATKEREFELTKENIITEKGQTLQENQIQRGRTEQDVANAIGQINTVEGQFQTDEGQDFDNNYRQVAEQIAASGGAETGMGRQQTADMIRLRNVTSQRQLDEFQGQREAKQLFKTRTFEDLLRGDQQAETLAQSKTKAAQFDLESYLEDLAYEETNFRFQNEADRLEAVLRDTQNYEKSGVEQFLASLAGKGYRAEDIAYNRQVYGV